MSADLRGFEYAPEPVLQQRRWQFDAALAHAGRAIARLAEAKRHHEALQAQFAQQRTAAVEAGNGRFDPLAHARAVQWLSRLQERIVAAAREVEALERARDEANERLRELHAQVEAIDAHRDDSLRAYALDAASRQCTRDDQEWLARRQAKDTRTQEIDS